MARQRHPPQSYGKSPARTQRPTRGRNAERPQQFISPVKHRKGQVNDKETLVRSQLQKALANKAIATALTDSDDSDRLVTKRKNAGKVQRPIYASGGVAVGDMPGAHPSRKRKSLDDGLDEESEGKRQETLQGSGSGLKRPAKSSLRSPLIPILPNAILSSSPVNLASSPPPAAPPVPSSDMRPSQNNLILLATDASLIGTLKPRRRQPSILQIIETTDSSLLTAHDEDEFLPDNESTPLPASRFAGLVNTPGSSFGRLNKNDIFSSGLRRPTPASQRKAASEILGERVYTPLSSSLDPTDPPGDTISKQKPSRSWQEDSIMAPPASSSPESSPPRSKAKSVTPSKTKKQTNQAASAEGMLRRSCRPQRPRRKGQGRSEFDIPEDSQGSQGEKRIQLDGPSDVSNSEASPFKPAKKPSRRRPTLQRPRRGTSVLSNMTTNSKVSKNGRGAGVKRKEKDGGGARHFDITSNARRGADKENTPSRGGVLDDVDGDVDELKKIRDKFQEVDNWDMVFEDVDVDGEGRGSQEGYR